MFQFFKRMPYRFCLVLAIMFITLVIYLRVNHKKVDFYLAPCNQNNMDLTLGDFRFQLLSETLFRLEEIGKNGFEDRSTFTILERDWPCVDYQKTEETDRTTISTKNYNIVFDHPGGKFQNLKISTLAGQLLFERNKSNEATGFLPEPGNKIKAWTLEDKPRMVPPAWGATPSPEKLNDKDLLYSGWDIDSVTSDIYIFVPGAGGYEQFRRDFLRLTGPIPLPPLYAFGLWTSRYYAYTEESALQTIRTFREKKIPLDVFVLDTDWRVGGATGYEINKAFFPNFKQFVIAVHNQNAHLVLNDHPQAVSDSALDYQETNYRYSQLTKILNLGVDAWWYDRNWSSHLNTPHKSISKEVWGMRVYHDITKQFRPGRRPLVLSNVDGINHGEWDKPSHPAAHRYPVWWTGDTKPDWNYLQKGVANAVNSGITRLMPYVSEDIGGHFGVPTDEFFIRSLQYGVFSPILRLHSSGETRYPWGFHKSTEEIAANYIRLRYRLLPYIYSSARRAHDEGVPLLRRGDLIWPAHKEAASDQQYMFGEDLLVAPIVDGKGLHRIPDELLHTGDGQQGLTGMYFDNLDLSGEPVAVRIDANVDFDWGEGNGSNPAEGVPEDHFSVRWVGQVGPIQKSGNYLFGVTADDGVRLWVGDKLIIDNWKDQGKTLITGTIQFKKGQIYDLKLEYYDRSFNALCEITWWNVDDTTISKQNLWVPPGSWEDLWTGKVVTGPQTITVSSPLWHMPLFVRRGGLILSIPQVEYTQQNKWDVIVVDAYPHAEAGKVLRTLYEDDGISVDYQQGQFCTTPLELQKLEDEIFLTIGSMHRQFKKAIDKRTWILRFHLRPGDKVKKITVDDDELLIQENSLKAGIPSAMLLPPSTRENEMIFLGRGERSKQEAGSILEIIMPDRDVQAQMSIHVAQ